MNNEQRLFSEELRAQPRSIWLKLRYLFECILGGDTYRARKILDSLRYHSDMSEEILTSLYKKISLAELLNGRNMLLNIPEDFLHTNSQYIPPLRNLSWKQKHPNPYPWAMSLPAIVGEGNNYQFLLEASYQNVHNNALNVQGIKIICSPSLPKSEDQIKHFLQQSNFDNMYQLPTNVTVFGMPGDNINVTTNSSIEFIDGRLFEGENLAKMASLIESEDLVIFLDMEFIINQHVLDKIVTIASVSEKIFIALVALEENDSQISFSSDKAVQNLFNSRFPFRNLQGFNFSVRGKYLQEIGLFDSRFATQVMAAKEFAFRAYNHGSWLIPVACDKCNQKQIPRIPKADLDLFASLCPNHWDRKSDGNYEIPKICIYIPAFNASNYIKRAIDSVLSQEVADLEICVVDDGSSDNTSKLVREAYNNEPRVKLLSNANGGIGFTSNQAINLSRSLYIGQLDSDDQLKPGAVKILADYLDENPNISCVYSSCERIDADGNYVQAEYSWPVFSREKMMVTSIAHHFRMFRRAAWKRTSGFREDIINAIDYDMFLKLSEVGKFHHIDKNLYQRRWHGKNTSKLNEGHQTANTYRVQYEALHRLGLRHWEVFNIDASQPRLITYRLKPDVKYVVFYPDYSKSNVYQRLLYDRAHGAAEIVGGDIDCAIRVLESGVASAGNVIFHLHWLNSIVSGHKTQAEAAKMVDAFIFKLRMFKAKGGMIIWTIHNSLSHEKKFVDVELNLSSTIVSLASIIHFHSQRSVAEVRRYFEIPESKIRVSRHGNYISAYPNYVSKQKAREILGIAPNDDVVLFTGQIRPYKGIENLVAAFRTIIDEKPTVRLVLAGKPSFDIRKAITPPLTARESERIMIIDRFIEDDELQLLYNAADFSAFPYTSILTSGSLLLSFSFGIPAIVPRVGMTEEVFGDGGPGVLYEIESGIDGIAEGLKQMLSCKDSGRLGLMQLAAKRAADLATWPKFSDVFNSPISE